jgi:hypothetical protein
MTSDALRASHEANDRGSERPNETASQPHRLCSRCITFGLRTLLPAKKSGGSVECIDQTLGSLATWDLEHCDICQFLFQSLPLRYHTSRPLEEQFKLVSKSNAEFVGDVGVILRALWYHDLEEKNLALETCRHTTDRQRSRAVIVLLRSETWPALQPTSAMIDFSMLSEWLRGPAHQAPRASTRKNAKGSDRYPRTTPFRSGSWKRARQGVLNMKLRVIDCKTRHLVPLPLEEEYVTLSYVWGQASGQIRRHTPRRPDSLLGSLRLAEPNAINTESNGLPLPSELPLTIEDSIRVCEALHYRYLWVDRYCVPQKDRQLRARQIQQMDDIYCGSALTLIACAGTGPQYGLPGVSKPRTPCPSLRTSNSEYLQMLPSIHDIHSSPWASRAWTYQEALLAQRRLFFTDRQVYFESNDLVESELTTLAPVVTRVLDPRIYSQVTSSAFPGDIYKCIREYTHRNLSFPADILNALSGTLTYYGREHGILHLWGIPFSANTPVSIDEPPRQRVITFEESLRWYARDDQVRRQGFPSWSWVGWMGTISWRSWRSDLKPAAAPLEQGSVSVEVELMSGELLSWVQYQLRHAELNDSSRFVGRAGAADQLSQFIHVEGFVSQVRYNREEGADDKGISWDDMSVEMLDGNEPITLGQFSNPIRDAVPPSQIPVRPAGSLLAVHFPCWHDSGKETSGSIVVVQQRGEYWERIALLDDDSRVLQHTKKTWMKIRLC